MEVSNPDCPCSDSLAGANFLLTGAAGGIVTETALVLARAGARIILAANDEGKARDFAARIRARCAVVCRECARNST